MGKLCARGKAAAKRKFKVYPSAYANMYASAVCSGKVTPGGKKKVQKKGTIEEVRSRQEFLKPSAKRKLKKEAAVRKTKREQAKARDPKNLY